MDNSRKSTKTSVSQPIASDQKKKAELPVEKGNNKERDSGEQKATSKDSPEVEKGKEIGRKYRDNFLKKKKRKKASNQDLQSAETILKSVLKDSSFKVPSLSRDIEDKFHCAPDYESSIKEVINSVEYKSILGNTEDIDDFDIDISVLPKDFSGHIQVSPMAWLDMRCINERPAQQQQQQMRWKRMKKHKKGKKSSDDRGTTDTTTSEAKKVLSTD